MIFAPPRDPSEYAGILDCGEDDARIFGEAARDAILRLPAEDAALLVTLVNRHEKPLRYDCSDGPVVALPEDEGRLQEAEHGCCGWEVSHVSVRGVRFVIGSCYGH